MKSVKGVLVDYIVEQVITRLMTEVALKAPFLSWGPFGVAIKYFAEKFLRWALDKTYLGAHILITDIRINHEIDELKSAIVKAHDPELSQEERERADEDIKKHMRHFVGFDRM